VTGTRISPWRAFKTDPGAWFDSEEIARAKRYVGPVNRAAEATSALQAVALVSAVALGVPGHVVRAVDAGPWPVQIVIVAALAAFALVVVESPSAAWRQLSYDRRWELSNQKARGFVLDQVKAVALFSVLLSVLGIPTWAVVRATSWWWLYGWLIFAAFTAGLGLLLPGVILPLFNKFVPLEDTGLRDELLDIARQVGADVGDVLVEDTSKRDRRTNAYVAGLGRTRRMVLCDTIVTEPTSHLRSVTAHELGHWKLRHTAKSLPIGVGLAFVAFVVLGAVLPMHAVLRFSHARRLGDPVMFLPFLIVFATAQSATGLVTSWLSRSFERQADLFALEVTSDVPSFLGAIRTLYTGNLADLSPSWWKRLRASHPRGAERLAMGAAWGAARQSGPQTSPATSALRALRR
jgi:STE24 endopeptidase